jgi:hypothetical protein
MISFEEEREFIYNICVTADEEDSIHSNPRQSRCSHLNGYVKQAGVGRTTAMLLQAATVQKASS